MADIAGTEVVMLKDGRMDRKNAAAYLGLSVKTLAMYACHGTGPEFIKRGKVFYFRADLDSWLEAGRAASTGQARRATKISKAVAEAAPEDAKKGATAALAANAAQKATSASAMKHARKSPATREKQGKPTTNSGRP